MYKITDPFRISSLSLKPGGEDVFVHFPGETRIYDKVKNPEAYARSTIQRMKKEGEALPLKIETKTKILWERS
jgi:hypothetical protein